MSRRAMIWIGLALVLAGCKARTAPIRIGVKAFDEQTILGEMLSVVLRQTGHEVAPLVKCEDTWRCHGMLREGRIDLLVEYTGTGLNYIGAPPGDATIERLRALYDPLGFEWRVPLGFDNGYRVLVPEEKAAAMRGIGALAGRPVRFAVPGEYLRRPGDGLAALISRYGLEAGEPLVIESPAARYDAVRVGRADAAIGYATDGAIREAGFRALADTAGFFPPYEAVVVLRADARALHPTLGEALDPLAGRIDTATMRRLDARVQVEGRSPQAVARAFLVEAGLVDAETAPPQGGPDVVLGHPPGPLADHVPRARRALRAAFPDRPVRVEPHRAPAEQLASGGARASIVGAEQLFRWSVRRRRWVRDDRFEALAVLGDRRLHVIRRADDAADALSGKLGIEAGTAGLAPRAMLGAVDLRPALLPAAELLTQVKGGGLDGALIFAAPDDQRVVDALADGRLALRPLTGWLTAERAVRLPFLRQARLPTRGGAPLETVGAQVVLAGAAPADALALGAGPAAALPAGGAPLSIEQVRIMGDTLGIAEAPDPALPSVWQRRATGGPPTDEGPSVLEVVLNGLILLFSGWLGWLLLRPRRPDEG